jgi:hypothetical protein
MKVNKSCPCACHESIRWNGDVAQNCLNIYTGWGSLYHDERKRPRYQLNGILAGPQGPGCFGVSDLA